MNPEATDKKTNVTHRFQLIEDQRRFEGGGGGCVFIRAHGGAVACQFAIPVYQ